MFFRVKVMLNRFLNWLSPARKARRRAELRVMLGQISDWLDELPRLPEDK